MAPAFSSLRQAVAFALLLSVTLLSPALVGRWGLPPRAQIYSSIGWRCGSFPYLHRQIFEEKGDIDIAFLGSSHMYSDIDTPYVQKQLSEKLGRPATVLSMCWFNQGFDTYYFVARDLLQHRKVRLLVFYDECTPTPNQPHISSWRWVRYGDDGADLAGLPFDFRLSYYFGSILGMSRNLLNDLRPNLATLAPQSLFYQEHPHALFPPDYLGAWTNRVGYIDQPDLFAPYSPQSAAAPSDVCLYAPDTGDRFVFSETPAAPLQAYFAGKFLSVAQDHATRLVCLNLPTTSEQHAKSIREGSLWLNCFGPQAALVGIAPAKLFAGLNDDNILKLYADPVHFNQNGQAYFTRIITPELIRLYEQAKP